MKIHGTAKGGALSTKDFGVAFSATATPASWMDDSDLKVYWKFNEASGNIDNASQSSDSLGSDGDLIMTGGTYEQSAPLGSTNALLFDGTDDFGAVSSGSNTLSQFNFIHEGKSTICFWMKLVSSVNYGLIFDNTGWSPKAGSFILTTRNAPCGTGCGTANHAVMNGEPLESNSTITNLNVGGSNFQYIPDITDYYFYAIRLDTSITADTVIWTRDNANEDTSDRVNAPLDANSTYDFNVGKRASSSQDFTNMEISEMSIWNRILTADEITELYNSGNARAIYE